MEPKSEIVLPPKPGLLVHGCYWPCQQTTAEIFAVSDAEREEADHSPAPEPSPDAIDVAMASGETSEIVSISSALSENTTLPSSLSGENTDSSMGREVDVADNEVEGESLSDCPASSHVLPPSDKRVLEALPQLKLRVEVPLWTDPNEAKHPPPQTQSEESDADTSITGTREPSPRLAQPVPVGEAENQDLADEGSADEEDGDADPTYIVSQGHGRFALRW